VKELPGWFGSQEFDAFKRAGILGNMGSNIRSAWLLKWPVASAGWRLCSQLSSSNFVFGGLSPSFV